MMPGSVEKTMLERPVLGQVVPAIVFLFPAVMAELTDQLCGECLRVQRGNPEPFVVGGLGLELAPAIVILCNRLFGSDDADRPRVIGRKR